MASIGTANLDLRSFDLNFEVSALIYDVKIASTLAETFDNDLKDAEEITFERWEKRSMSRKLLERILRLTSPFL